LSLQKAIATFIPQGVFIITAKDGEKVNGMTAAWVSQVSFKPRLLAVAIAPQRYTYELIKNSGFFCINTLGENQTELAKHFGFKSGKEVNKFEGIEYKPALHGCPVLKEALAYFECELVGECEAGDHLILLGEVQDYEVLKPDEKPLIFKWEDFFGG